MTKDDVIGVLQDCMATAGDVIALDGITELVRWLELRSRQEDMSLQDWARKSANQCGFVADACDLLGDLEQPAEIEIALAERHGVSPQTVARIPAAWSVRLRLRAKCLSLCAELISRHPDREIKAETVNWLLWRRFPELCQRVDVSTMSLDQTEPILRDFLTRVAPDASAELPKADSGQARHAPDYASVEWYGTFYEFTQNQAACVRVLWEAWENRTPAVGESAVLESAEVNSPLRIVFRDHPAWGTMIVQAATKGRFRLQEPSG